MKAPQIYEDLSILFHRSRIAFAIVKVVFIILVIFLWKIQILDHNQYWKKSEANRIREVVIQAPRGLITDRSGIILAKNVASFKATLIRENIQNFKESSSKIAALLDLEQEELQNRIKKYEFLPSFKPIVIKDNLSFEEISRIEARKLDCPELSVETEPKREYPFGHFASHVIGYLQEVSPEELRSEKFKNKHPGDLIGKTGIEYEYEERLAGEDGHFFETVDSLGRSKGEIARREPGPGQTIHLSIDFDLQKKAENLLEGKEGAIVVMDPASGEVLALASYPDFNPNKFVNRFTPADWMKIVENPDYPLENRALRGLYAPGSLFKLTVGVAALDLNLASENTRYFCSGNIILHGRLFSCWFKPGHGWINLFSGIEHSCNIYFYQLGKNVGIENIARYARGLGFGKKTGIDLPGEKEGLVPDPQWKKEVRNAPWYPGETISVSIGQGPLLVTPLQIAVHTAYLANRGKRVVPHISLNNPQNKEMLKNAQKENMEIGRGIFEKIIRGMWKAVNEDGTARAAALKGYDVCGKTGSTQVIGREKAEKLEKKTRVKIKTHSWFTGFAPKDNPRIVVTALVEYGGTGGTTAAPLAKELLTVFREKNDQ